MQGDDPPYLSVGTAVSAKYKGAFCEAKVSKVVRIVKCKVTYKMGLGTATVSDEHIKGNLRVGQLVQAKHPDKKDFVDATITKIQDCSQYTVVFDDGDITTLRRTALCLKSGRHFNESETLDQLPLTHPEHFGNPVVGGRRGRRSRQLKEDSSEGEPEEENEPDLDLYSADIGRVVSVESSEKKRNKDNWFPGLIVMPSAQPTVKINVKDEFLVRSFKDGRYYTVPKKEVSEFTRELGTKVESSSLSEAVVKALRYLNEDELPIHWEKNSLFNTQGQYSDSEENFTDSSDDEPREEKDHFVAQLYKFMDDSGTPLNKSPMISNKDVDLYRLFRVVHKLGGYNRVTNQTKWRSVAARLRFASNNNTSNQVKSVYKKCLYSYESFYRTLGCTMSDITRSTKKNRGRSLIRDKDRVTPVQSPRPDKEEIDNTEKKEEEEKEKDKGKLKKPDVKKTLDDEKKRLVENSDTNSNDTTDQVVVVAGPSKDNTRLKRAELVKTNREKKVKTPVIEKVKVQEKVEEVVKNEEKEDEKVQQTRSKALVLKSKDVTSPERKTREQRTPMRDRDPASKIIPSKIPKKIIEEEKKRGRKRPNADDKPNSEGVPEPVATIPPVNIGDKLKVYYGPTHESKVTYEAKIIEIDRESQSPIYLVHYTGWNTRYDEWITPNRIAENLSAATKAKRLKQGSLNAKASTSASKPAGKRGRGTSITGKSTIPDPPRSTTPSSVTSSSSRTKSPATPVTRSRITRQGETNRRTRRTSVQTDISAQSDSDSVGSESESEQLRTRSGNKSEDGETKPVRKKLTKTKSEKRKDDDDTEKEDEIEKPKKVLRKLKKTQAEIKPVEESDDESVNPPKGRDFDLNQIRSELKGFTKAIKIPSTENSEKEAVSSDESTNVPEVKSPPDDDEEEEEEDEEEEEVEDKKEKPAENTSSSDDIYEFKEPEPFEFESPKISDDKNKKRLVPRVLDNVEKSPKKKSPKAIVKSDIKELDEKKRFKRNLVKKDDDEEEEEEEEEDIEVKMEEIEDPFDKLVESPSFHIGKSTTTDRTEDFKKVSKVLSLDEPFSLFKELPISVDDECEERLDISDDENDDKNEPLFTHKEQLFTSDTFSKVSPEHNIDSDCAGFTPQSDDRKPMTSDDEDLIRATLQNVLTFDNDSNDALLITQPTVGYETPKREDVTLSSTISLNRVESEDESKPPELFVEDKDTVQKIATLSSQIAPVFQETDSAFLKDLCKQPPQFLTKVDDLKDISLKTRTTIADSILQKFSLMKNELSPVKPEVCIDKEEPLNEIDVEEKIEAEEEIPESKLKVEPKCKPVEVQPKSPEPKIKCIDKLKIEPEHKRRSSRKVVSREFIDESDSDSSGSEERLIMDEDSQTSLSLDTKPDVKESDSNASFIKTDIVEVEPERNFKFDDTTQSVEVKEEDKIEVEGNKEEEPDSHSLLYCEETIPGSPAPAPTNEPKQKSKNELEMPFASAPSSSATSSKNIIVNEPKSINKERIVPAPLTVNLDNQEKADASAVLDNTPPTTPESTISNLSPRGENGGLSPNTGDNESCRSTEADGDYSNQRSISASKVSHYSEEDTLMNSELNSTSKKNRDDMLPSPCKKRRRSFKGSDDVPVKRGRKPNRSRHNSDSDDTSEHSAQGITSLGSTNNIESRLTRSPRPSKYNFFVEFDPSLDSAQRIAVLQQKLSELRKTYADVKAELATIERRRKKIRRREREALKAAKQEMACT